MRYDDQALMLLRQIVRTIDLNAKELSRHSGLTTPQLILLQTISSAGALPVGKIARAMNLTQATVTTIVDRLEGRGLVQRERGTHDKRQVLVSMTNAGGEALANSPTALQEQFVTRFTQLQSWEQSQIVAALERVSSLLGGSNIDAAPLLTVGAIDRAD